jgi:hypothetical protein
MSKQSIRILLKLAFEQGRRYEQIYTSLDLYNSINYQELLEATAKGANFNFGNSNFDNFGQSRFSNLSNIEQRKFDELKNIKNSLNQYLIDFEELTK